MPINFFAIDNAAYCLPRSQLGGSEPPSPYASNCHRPTGWPWAGKTSLITITIAIKIIIIIMIMIMTLTRVDPFALKGCSTSGKRVPVQILQFR